MLRLILDRSGGCAGFAFADESKVICEKLWEGGSIRSPEWFAEISAQLDAAGCSVVDVDEFVCAVGPGSFSGIRSALAALEGMALPGNKKVYGISSAAALAYEYGGVDYNSVTVIGDARRSRLWISSFKLDPRTGLMLLDNRAVSQTADDFELVKAEDAVNSVPEGTLILSPDWDRIGDLLMDSFPAERLVQKKLSSSAAVIALMASKFPGLCRPEPMPVYLHPAVVSGK
jgi:tRNA threonylcarbamoyl adenosine modification protein YeaZ